ncbi:MAG: hypothetical protein ACOCV4_02320 [Myxococcota bacterium]
MVRDPAQLTAVRLRVGLASTAVVLAVGALGCSDLSEFDTGPDQVYRGRVLGVDNPSAGSGSFIRRGFPQGTSMELRFDSDQASSPRAGQIWTDDTDCGGPSFDGTWLRAVPPLQHDALSLYDFPGSGRIQNFIYAARPDTGPLGGRDVTVFLSLSRDESMEVRVLSGFGQQTCGPCECYFGVFPLTKEPATP